jgi:hypothetical protein
MPWSSRANGALQCAVARDSRLASRYVALRHVTGRFWACGYQLDVKDRNTRSMYSLAPAKQRSFQCRRAVTVSTLGSVHMDLTGGLHDITAGTVDRLARPMDDSTPPASSG